MKWFLTPMLLCLLGTVCAQTDTSSLTAGYAPENYHIRFPDTWELDTSGLMGTEFLVFSPVEDEYDRFRENVNFLIQDLHGSPVDLKTYAQLSERQIMDLATNVEMFESQTIEKGNSEYHHFIYSMTMGILNLKVEQYCFIANDTAYVLTFTAETDKFDAFRPVGVAILNSFALKN